MAAVKLTHKENKLTNAVIIDAFAALEAVVNEDARELARVDSEIAALQAKLKGLKFNDDVLAPSEIDITEGVLIYDFTKKQILVSDGDTAAVALLKAPAKIRKEVHGLWLTELMNQIAKDYAEAKQEA
jgi:hypothetical protein